MTCVLREKERGTCTLVKAIDCSLLVKGREDALHARAKLLRLKSLLKLLFSPVLVIVFREAFIAFTYVVTVRKRDTMIRKCFPSMPQSTGC